MEELPENAGTEIYHWGSQCPYSDGKGNVPPGRRPNEISKRSMERILEEEAESLGVKLNEISRKGSKLD